ncbi:MAG: hypothetical protein IJT94_17260 [Oscillibacter sp.]|nr:hypothetical protein [Oscillibacter sp.]
MEKQNVEEPIQGGGTPPESSLLSLILGKLLSALLLILSIWILFRLPTEMTLFSWCAFTTAVLLFCFGFFPLAGDLSDDKNGAVWLAQNVALMVLAAVLPPVGLWRVYMHGGGEGSLAAAILLMIESPVIFAYVDDRIEKAEITRRLLLVLSVLMFLGGFWLLGQYVLHENGRGQVEAATLLWIESIILWGANFKGKEEKEE